MKIPIMLPTEVNLKTVSVHVKVTDSGNYELKDDTGRIIKEISDYVPSFFPGQHYGDYIILDIDLETGLITNWKKPSVESLVKIINGDEE